MLKNLTLVVRFMIWAAALLFIFDNLEVNITAFVASLGIGGVAIALAAQAVLGDAFSSFAIFMDKPFQVGDFIIVGDLLGTVEHVGFKTTRIRSLGGEELVFSNSDLTSSRIKNYKRMRERRVVFSVGVIYQTPVEKVKALPPMIKRVVEEHQTARFDRAHLQPGFPFWTSRPSPLYTQNLLPGPICCCGPLGMPSKPSAGCARRSRRANRRGSGTFLRHLPHIAPCRRPRSRDAIGRQPAGTGSAQIRWSIAPNSRRVRWLSASRSQ